ncbi:MAG: hypothetical protein ACRCVQ_07505 [Acinetobacter ursingii]
MSRTNQRSWRHTPFRNLTYSPRLTISSSWRHTPFRKNQFALKWI